MSGDGPRMLAFAAATAAGAERAAEALRSRSAGASGDELQVLTGEAIEHQRRLSSLAHDVALDPAVHIAGTPPHEALVIINRALGHLADAIESALLAYMRLSISLRKRRTNCGGRRRRRRRLRG